MRLAPLALATLLLAAPSGAFAEDPAPPADDGPADAVKEERRTSPEADKALARYTELLHLPVHLGKERLEVSAEADGVPGVTGGKPTFTIKWQKGKGLSLDVELPKEMLENYPPEALDMTKGGLLTFAQETLAPVLVSPSHYVADYHVSHKSENQRDIVKLLPYAEDTAAERQTLYFNVEGLVERRVLVARVDPNDPMGAMLAGVEIDSQFEYAKKGERNVVTRMSALLPFGDLIATYEYYELPDGVVLPKSVSLVTPFSPEPIDVHFANYELDGKLLEGTRPAEAPATTPGSDGGESGAGGEKEDGEKKDEEKGGE